MSLRPWVSCWGLTSTRNISNWGKWGKRGEGMECSGLLEPWLLSLGMACPAAHHPSLISRMSLLFCWLHWKPTAVVNLLLRALPPTMQWLFNLHGLYAWQQDAVSCQASKHRVQWCKGFTSIQWSLILTSLSLRCFKWPAERKPHHSSDPEAFLLVQKLKE